MSASPINFLKRLILCVCLTPLLAACADARSDEPDVLPVTAEIEHVKGLRPQDKVGLASATGLSMDSGGRIYIGDASDHVIKVFGADGVQGASIGAAGGGPGEFMALLSAGTLGDSAFAWDGPANRLTVFSPDGRYARMMPLHLPGSPPWHTFTAMDDSLLVGSGWVMGVHDRPLVEVFGRGGERIGQMMNMARVLSPPDPELLPHTSVFADGRDGVVFATLHGFDTIVAYSPRGRFAGAGRIGLARHEPVLDLPRLLSRSGGSLKRPDGSWAQDRHYAVLKLVALGDGLAAVQFGLMDLRQGTDLLSDGGPIVVVRLGADGVIRPVAQVESPGALLGRSGRGEALILRWSGGNLETLDLFRLRVRTTGGGAS